MKNKRRQQLIRTVTLHLPLAFFLIIILFPFYWTLCTALKPETDIIKLPIRYIPMAVTLENFKTVWRDSGFSTYFYNSTVTSVFSVFAIVICSLLGGYAISRYEFRGKKTVLMSLLLTQMLPAIILVIPLFRIYYNLGLINTRMSLLLTYTTTQLPFCIIMMSGFFSTIPPQMEEAAKIDGCSLMGAIFRVILPTIAPGIVATAAFAFVGSWNEFFYALSFINNSKLFTVPVGLSMMKGEFTIQYGSLAAGGIISLIPVLILFAYIQKYLVTGLSAGAVKG